DELGGAFEAVTRRLGQTFAQRVFDVTRELTHELPCWRYLFVDVREQDADRGVGLERHAAGEHLVRDDCQRVTVGRRTDRLARALLWRHVLGRPEDQTAGGEAPS